MLRIITDGSCKGNPGPTGWAAVLVRDDEIIKEVTGGSLMRETNNIAEFRAILYGLLAASEFVFEGEKVLVVSDSTLCIGYLSKNWRSKNAALGRLRLEVRKAERALNVPVVAYEKGSVKDELFQLVDVLAKDAVPQGYEEKATAQPG